VSPTRLSDLLDSVLADLPPSTRNQTPTVDLPADLPPLAIDFVLISRVLNNLLQNAMRHSPRDAPISVSARMTGPDTVTVCVTDCGPGVPPERRDEIFHLLVRRAGDTGSGLGLAIAKTFVEAHQQRIWVQNSPGGGARFCFTLPVASSQPTES
jgi:two-component system sensor histidine kinase KdpD